MKTREDRRNVVIAARLRGPVGWHDACILNVSSRGLMVRCTAPAQRGAYVEIRRGAHVIVARVAWTQGGRFGVRAQDPVPVQALVADPDRANVPSAGPDASVERRTAPRPVERRHEDSRHQGRWLEFAAFAVAGTFVAGLAFTAIGEALARPMTAIGVAIGPK